MIKKLLVGFSALIVLYILGPKVEYEPVTLFETSLGKTGAELENYITEKEKRINDLKENNASKIYWYHDSLKQKTTYVVLYLHGFSASPEEGKDFVLEFGKNMAVMSISPDWRTTEEMIRCHLSILLLTIIFNPPKMQWMSPKI
ncbi:MAG: hypothetical protein IPG79_10440 [Saprospiraceae bacterium]|nr:hypothetical protein [Saprospiraceae bacterium]